MFTCFQIPMSQQRMITVAYVMVLHQQQQDSALITGLREDQRILKQASVPGIIQ
jgi:hypothetical protein